MTQHETLLINKLIDKYEKKVVQNGRLSVSINICDIFPDYKTTDITIEKFESINAAVQNFLNKKFITSKRRDPFDTRYDILILNIEKIDELYSMVKRTRVELIINKKREIIKKYSGKNEILDNYIDKLLTKLNNFNITGILKDDEKLNNVLMGMLSVLENEDFIYYRAFSIKVYGDSKVFENNYIDLICSEIYQNGNFEYIESNNKHDILEIYNIYKTGDPIWMKGNAILTINDQDIDLSNFKNGFAISSKDIDSISQINIKTDKVYTIENLTTFNTFSCEDSFVLFLSGFHNKSKTKFLKKVYDQNNNISYFHFGDIDAGGFYIYLNLINKTNIPFIPYKMDIATLSNPNYTKKKLEGEDEKRLNQLLQKNTIFSDTIEYMIKHNCKLEQESIF